MSEIQDMTAVIQLGSKGMYYLIKGEIKAAMALVQLLQKLTKSGRFSVGEMKNLEKLMKVSEGQIQFISIPTEDPQKIEKLRSDLNKLGVQFTLMPDLNVGDGQIHIAVAQKDMPLVSQWYQAFCTSTLIAGGKQQYEHLMSLTQGQVDIVSIPVEDRNQEKLEKMYQDFEKLHINYAKLPDLNVGDGKIQIVYAQADAPKLREWYSQYQADILKETGELLPELDTISMQQYTDTANRTPQSYWDSATPETKQEIHQAAMEQVQPGFRTPEKERKNFMTAVEYQAALKQPGAIDVTINEKLVIDKAKVVIRLPHTQEFIILPPNMVFEGADGGKTYAAILDKDGIYERISKNGQKLDSMTGKDVYTHFDTVSRDMSKKVRDKVRDKAQQVDILKIPKKL